MSRISRDEFRKVLYKLKMSGSFSNHEIDEVENIFYASLHESGPSAGISTGELENGIQYLKRHPENHHLSHDELSKLEEVLRSYL